MTNECSVCLEEIALTTGSATMACGHCFHIGCLARWLTKNQSCPYCRHEANEHERINEDLEEDESTEYEEDSEEGDARDEDMGEQWVRVGTGRWITIRQRQQRQEPLAIPEYNEEAHALWVFRKTMEMLESGEELGAQKELPRPAIELPEIRYTYRDHLIDPHDGGYETD